MAHTNDGSLSRQVDETQVTARRPKRKRRFAASLGVMGGGGGLVAGLLTDALDPEVTSAILAVVTVTFAVVQRLVRRPATVAEVAPQVGNEPSMSNSD
ncbi:hypothetical protein [Streptomyces sp. NPDC013489]|uniref:hypothetical protein n=1 Tax=Streptomyces sp. NPDC013489 TaxID=3155606 RepID=UPI0033EBD286